MFSPVAASSSRNNLRKWQEQNCHPKGHLHMFGASPEGQAGSTTGSCQLQGFSKHDLGAPWETRMENGHIINQLNFMT